MRLKKVSDKGSYEIYQYSPTLFKPFYVELEKVSLRRRIRFMIAFFVGYSVFYLVKDGRYAGYCLVQSGKDSRYKFATENDIIVGPYYISEQYRGQKLSIELLKFILNDSDLNYNNAYDYIDKENLPSLKASKAVGFKHMTDANVTKYTRRLKICKNKGQYAILVYKNSSLK